MCMSVRVMVRVKLYERMRINDIVIVIIRVKGSGEIQGEVFRVKLG